MNATSSNFVDDNGVVIGVRVRNWRNWKSDIDKDVEVMDQETILTVPDMVLSMQQILERHKRGVQLPANAGFYDNELDPRLERMDKFDVIDAVREAAAATSEFNDSLAKKKREKENAEKQELERLRALAASLPKDQSSDQGDHVTDGK